MGGGDGRLVGLTPVARLRHACLKRVAVRHGRQPDHGDPRRLGSVRRAFGITAPPCPNLMPDWTAGTRTEPVDLIDSIELLRLFMRARSRALKQRQTHAESVIADSYTRRSQLNISQGCQGSASLSERGRGAAGRFLVWNQR